MDALATVLLRRAGAVPLPAPEGPPPADGEAWVGAVEADLAARGWLLDPPLRRRFAGLDAAARLRWADWVCAVADESTGADRDHVPLFRGFPDTPADPGRLYVERLIVHLLQADAAPCVLCGTVGSVHPLDPCGHPVCEVCFDPRAYSACPICGRRLTAGNAYLPVVAAPGAGAGATRPVRLRRLHLEPDPAAAAVRLRDDLVARPAALSEADLADLRTLVAATAPDRLDWLPAVVPARETLAAVIAWSLHATALRPSFAAVVEAAAARWGTATDVARTLWAYSDGDPGLVLPRRRAADGPNEGWRPTGEPRVTVAPPRVRALPRPLRRAALGFIDALDCVTAAEDVARHPTVWKRLAERLHPFERVAAHPDAAVVFAALRGTRTPAGSPLGRAMTAASGRDRDRIVLGEHAGGLVSVRVRTFAALVEDAVAGGDAAGAAELLGRRPGDLWRRVDHLLRLAGDDDKARGRVLDAAARVAPRVAPGVLAAAAAELTGRDATVAVPEEGTAAIAAPEEVAMSAAAPITESAAVPVTRIGAVGDAVRRALGLRPPPVARRQRRNPVSGPPPGTPRRTFFPKGDVVRTWTEPERRAALPAAAIAAIRSTVDAELAGRAARLERFDIAVLDAALAEVPAPTRERAGSEQLAGWPRGSVRRLDAAPVLRLFLHWVDSEHSRVDLDLSCAFYDEAWAPVGHCDYTHLRFKGDAAIHSGDLTSAPPPLGATEFLDLDRDRLRAAGVTWAVPVVLSYNDVPFEALTAAFAGFSLPQGRGAAFDAARVMQRFGLRGDARSLAPMVLHVPTGAVMWIDASLTTKGYGHNVGQHGARLGRVAADLWEHFAAGNRATLLDVAAWHAAARADRVVVAHADGSATTIPAAAPAEVAAAVRAAASLSGASGTAGIPASARTFAAAADPDRLAAIAGGDVAEGSLALLVDGAAGAPWTPVSAADLLAGLVPAPLDTPR
ncbi:MXAN_6230/SCO0854 family RING domain-containing protein [Dactylosporangium sp. NPDC048998]|uniref:MXAN_6230/SCO0854 family RING domain-containing protein n=1 Tax=Dactylosporangium sp. NPDC048998 TaxID=3363976 RepID=UPI003717838F